MEGDSREVERGKKQEGNQTAGLEVDQRISLSCLRYSKVSLPLLSFVTRPLWTL